MAKSNFTKTELAVWDSIYGKSHGPTPARMRILVEDFSSRGLTPCMMMVAGILLPYSEKAFSEAMQHSIAYKEDDYVNVYYHAADCERVAGSDASTWIHWGNLIATKVGLNLDLDVRKTHLSTDVRETLLARGVRSIPTPRLLSLRMVAFYIAAQYEAWATQEEVSKVSPFKDILHKIGYQVRNVVVRKDPGLDSFLLELEAAGFEEATTPTTTDRPMSELLFQDFGPKASPKTYPIPVELKAPPISTPLPKVEIFTPADADLEAVKGKLSQLIRHSLAMRGNALHRNLESLSEEDLQTTQDEIRELLQAAQQKLRDVFRVKLAKRYVGSTIKELVFDDTSNKVTHIKVALDTGDVNLQVDWFNLP